MKSSALLACLLGGSLAASAGGYQLNTAGIKALGLGGAFTAYGRDASAVFFNPGALARLDTNAISLGAVVLRPQTAFRSQNTGLQTVSPAVYKVTGHAYAVYQLSNKLAAGLGIYQPFGYETKWDAGWEGRAVVRESSLSTVFVQPTLSYQLSDNFSIGGGLMLGRGKAAFSRQIGLYEFGMTSEGSGFGLGYNVGLVGSLDENLSFGISYRSKVDMDVTNGEAKFSGVPGNLTGQYPATASYKSEINLPSTLSVGFTDRLNKQFAVIFEFNLTGWDSNDSLRLNFENASTPRTTRARVYQDAMSFRIGVQYDHNERLVLRGGFLYEESPVKDQNVSPELPDANRLGVTAGLTYHLLPHLDLDAAYIFQDYRDRVVQSSGTSAANPVLSGTYKSVSHGAGIGLSYSF